MSSEQTTIDFNGPTDGGDDGNAPAGLTGPHRFDPDIAREKIGLKGNAIDHRIIRPISCAQASIAAMASIARRMTSLASRSAFVIV